MTDRVTATVKKSAIFTTPEDKEKHQNNNEKDNEIFDLKSEIEHLQSVIDIYQGWLNQFITSFENDCMDGIAEMRMKREQLQRFESKEL
jgi:hypothetical protein